MDKKKVKIYLSGPISNTEDYVERFDKAAEQLIEMGYTVINPARVGLYLPEETTHDEYMLMSFCLMRMCDTIFMLKGWENSIGAKLELHNAERRRMSIFFEGGV